MIAGKLQLLNRARAVHRRFGKSILDQFAEIVRLRLGPGRLSASEYFEYQLYDDSRFSFADKQAYGSWQVMDMLADRLNDISWEACSEDKLVFHALLEGLGLPYPEVLALAWDRPRDLGRLPVYTPAESVIDYLRDGIEYPFFCKPVRSNLGRGAVSVKAYSAESDCFVLGDQTRVAADRFLANLHDPTGYGYLFQRHLQPHPLLAELCGPRASSVRVVMLVGDEDTRVFRMIWKIPVGDNMVDNFAEGRSGNLLAKIDNDSGRIERVVAGMGIDGREVTRHPDTGATLTGVELPDWSALLEISHRAAAAFATFRWQGWDIAVTPEGPKILEVNQVGGIHSMQYAWSEGVLNEEMRTFLKRYGR